MAPCLGRFCPYADQIVAVALHRGIWTQIHNRVEALRIAVPAPQAHGALADAMRMGDTHNQPPALHCPPPAPRPAAALLRRLSLRANISQMAPKHATNRQGIINILVAGLI